MDMPLPGFIVLNIMVFISSALFMELVAWFSHRYIMHGFLWILHKDHHIPHKGRFEKNDLFVLLFASPAILALVFGIHAMNWLLISAGAGITLYGIGYTLFHDIMFHRRIKSWKLYKLAQQHRYFVAIINAHRHHHKHTGQHDTEAFGFLWAPKKYWVEKAPRDNKP